MTITQHHTWLKELTSTPTAAGCEHRVAAWVRRLVKQRSAWRLSSDRHGNLTIQRKAAGKHGKRGRPIYITAHMDHPAFVVQQVHDDKTLMAQFRGSVEESYFLGTPVKLHQKDGATARGVIRSLEPTFRDPFPLGRQVWVSFSKPVEAAAGDVMTWDIPPARIVKGMLRAPACDDLAGVAAAVAAYDSLPRSCPHDVRLLLTRAEETGFIGAIAAARDRLLPDDALLICLENSKSFAESPIGAGPIVRVGDRTSTFDPDLTYRISRIAEKLAEADPSFRWQRKLMPGGTCEASAFLCYGYTATCLCLPLGNYHNMNETTGRIGAETISVRDFDHFVRLLVVCAISLGDDQASPGLKTRLEELYAHRGFLLQNPL
ncbi:MAG: M20/M25/M40 family metallo-hydrolase [Phycisphaeraceae bacterium]|nr:M20/M25/M40 family metallo-hydrolase [Phycisphaeraceae bacterium]